jgi:hypothetical protein
MHVSLDWLVVFKKYRVKKITQALVTFATNAG